MLANSLPHYKGTDDSLTREPTTNVGPYIVDILTAPPRHGVHTSPGSWGVPSSFVRFAALRTRQSTPAPSAQQVIDFPCQRALAFDAHDRIRLSDCLRHVSRQVCACKSRCSKSVLQPAAVVTSPGPEIS
jgi:hypothetical protein